MQYSVKFYVDLSGEKPVAVFIADLCTKNPGLCSLVKAGIKKLEDRRYHRPPLTELVDPDHDIYELRVGGKNIARVFWFFQPGRLIILTNGHVKKGQKLDPNQLQRARDCKRAWEERTA